MKGRIHSCESFGAADGPGVRFVVFLQGCGFRCRYCHNPDTWAGDACEEMEADEVLARALRYRAYWGEEGGITLSGGEPMLQAEFAADLFARCRSAGVTTCLDTAAGPFRRDDAQVTRLLGLADTVLLDLKAMDPAAHRRLTGADNAPVLDCARYLAEKGVATWIRHVVVPGLTDSPDELAAIDAFVKPMANVRKVEMLPYHTFGVEKWKRLGLRYTLDDLLPADANVEGGCGGRPLSWPGK